jgi:hypothetical protein
MSLFDLKQLITSWAANGGNGGEADCQNQFFRVTHRPLMAQTANSKQTT